VESFIRRLVERHVTSSASLRADAAAVAVVITSGDLDGDRWVRRIEVRSLDGARLGETDGPADTSPRWAPVGDRLAFVRPDDRGIAQLWVIDALGDVGRCVTHLAGGVRAFRWSAEGTRLAVVASGEARSTSDGLSVTSVLGYKADGRGFGPPPDVLGVVDVLSGVWSEVRAPAPSIVDATFANDGRALLVSCGFDDRSWRHDVVRVDIASGEHEAITTHHGPWDRAACPTELDDRSVVYVGGEAGPGHATLQIIRDGICERLAPQLDRNVTVGSPAYPGSPPIVVGTDVWFTANDLGASRLFRTSADSGTGTSTDPITPPELVITGVDVRAGVVIATAATPTDPGLLALVEQDGPWRPIGGQDDPLDVPWVAERFTAVAPDGSSVPAVLLRSRFAGTGAAPLLLDIHGGPHNAANSAIGPGNLHRWHLAAEGWHVLLANPRGSDGFGEAWYRGLETNGGWAGDDADDLLALVDAAVERGIADAGRLAVTGYSYGGLMTAMLTARTDRFTSAVMGGAPVDLAAFVASSDLGPVLFRREVGGSVTDPSEFDRRSPIRQVDRVRTPTLVLHGLADQRVPVSQAEQWFQSLREIGVVCELALYRDAPHGFVTAGAPRTVIDVGRRTAAWILAHGRRSG
jgi:dipeptidyl aminopeptidase/acylaminoacyl peptidase